MSNKIPTAEDFIKYYWIDDNNRNKTNADMLNDYAKLHRKAILEAAAEKANIKLTPHEYSKYYWEDYVEGVDKDSILNAYPENLII